MLPRCGGITLNHDEDTLLKGRELLARAAEAYDRPLKPEDYWWLGAGLAACTLAELNDKSYAVGRIEQLMTRLGQKGAEGDWVQRFVEELAALDAEGVLWPVYERSAEGPLVPTGVAIHPSFDADAGYYLALAHLAIAIAVNQENEKAVSTMAETIGEMVESGLSDEHRTRILAMLTAEEEQP